LVGVKSEDRHRHGEGDAEGEDEEQIAKIVRSNDSQQQLHQDQLEEEQRNLG
jgi:hypothetical protein